MDNITKFSDVAELAKISASSAKKVQDNVYKVKITVSVSIDADTSLKIKLPWYVEANSVQDAIKRGPEAFKTEMFDVIVAKLDQRLEEEGL